MKLRRWLNGLRTLLFGDITDNGSSANWSRNKIGKHGELVALSYLKRLGWRLVDSNVRIGVDELDLLVISPDEKVMAIVEVRTTARTHGSPERTVTHKKRRCMLRVARKLRSFADVHRCTLRVDLIAVRINAPEHLIRHYEGIFPLPKR